MHTNPEKPAPVRAPALEVELTKGPDGKLRSFRFSIGTAVVLLLLASAGGHASERLVPALKWIAELVRRIG